MEKKLILIPILHTITEMTLKAEGKFKRMPGELKNLDTKKLLQMETDDIGGTINKYWVGIKEILDRRLMNEDFSKIKIYNDAMDKIPNDDLIEFSAKVSKNWSIIRELKKKGATLMKTECSLFLDENERALAKGKMIDTTRRDRYIARTISKTLMDGELGILFIGLGHQVHKYVDRKTIEIEWPILSEEDADEMRKKWNRMGER